MAYIKMSPQEKTMKAVYTALKNLQKSNMWASFCRAICYPHKGMTYSHTYIITGWFDMLVRRGDTKRFFEWVEAYRQHCDALPVTRKGGRAKEIATPHLFTEDMFWTMLNNDYAPDHIFEVMQQYLAPLLPIDVFLPEGLSPTFEEMLSIFGTVGVEPSLCGVLTQKEDRPFRVQATKDSRWKDPGYVFTDPLTPDKPEGWEKTFPQNYDWLLYDKLEKMSHELDCLRHAREHAMVSLKGKGRPLKTEQSGSGSSPGEDLSTDLEKVVDPE